MIVQQEMIAQTKEIIINVTQNVAAQLNNEQLLAYWNIGHIIVAHEFFLGYSKFQSLTGKLTWAHYCELMSISDRDRRIFYEFL